jgi:hypothetical protein
MRSSLKIRAFLMLVAVLVTAMALALPEPAAACWIGFAQHCYYPNGAYCYTPGCGGTTQCNCAPSGTPTCDYEEVCCP